MKYIIDNNQLWYNLESQDNSYLLGSFDGDRNIKMLYDLPSKIRNKLKNDLKNDLKNELKNELNLDFSSAKGKLRCGIENKLSIMFFVFKKLFLFIIMNSLVTSIVLFAAFLFLKIDLTEIPKISPEALFELVLFASIIFLIAGVFIGIYLFDKHYSDSRNEDGVIIKFKSQHEVFMGSLLRYPDDLIHNVEIYHAMSDEAPLSAPEFKENSDLTHQNEKDHETPKNETKNDFSP